jgi:hypothetical protein
MAKSDVSAMKKWMEAMGFELVNSHNLEDQELIINYYVLGNFGIYEEISNYALGIHYTRFITWNPWGIDFEVQSLKELGDAYQDYIIFNPEIKS